jgi:hypothetical protein
MFSEHHLSDTLNVPAPVFPAPMQSLHQTMGVYSTMGDRATQVETVLRPGELGEPLPHPLYE